MMKIFFRLLVPIVIAPAFPACIEPAPVEDHFEVTGELIALSGGDAGASGACIACHGLQGEGDGYLVPRLAGLDPGYFVRQMALFAEGQRRHPQMAWIAGQIDWPARQKLARYYADLSIPDGVPPLPAPTDCAVEGLYHHGDPSRGLPSCASCHGEAGEGVGRGNPPLAAQPADYLAEQLNAWATGRRYGDPDGMMTKISHKLSVAERTRLATYASSMSGVLAYRQPRAICPPARRLDPRNGA